MRFIGQGSVGSHDCKAFDSITITGGQVEIFVRNCSIGANGDTGASVTADVDTLFLYLDHVNCSGDIIGTRHNTTLQLISQSVSATVGYVSADDEPLAILVSGVTPNSGGTTISCASGSPEITIIDCARYSYHDSNSKSLWSVDSQNSVLNVTQSILENATFQGGMFIDSRITGSFTNNDPSGTFFQDVLLSQGYDFAYDFDVDGGTGSPSLRPFPNTNYVLPNNFVVTGATLEIITPLDSANHLATVALGTGLVGDDLQAATIVSAPPWSTAHLAAITILSKMDGANPPYITIAVEDLTAGKFNLHIDGYQDVAS